MNVLRKVQGDKSTSANGLSELGVSQATSLRNELSNVNFDICYTSPITRAIETTKILVKERDIQVIETPMLKEKKQGSMVGLDVSIHIAKYSNWEDITEDERLDYKLVPDEESQRELRGRAMEVLTDIAITNVGKTILVVTHGGFMRSVYTYLENKTFKDNRWKFDNCGYMKLVYKDSKFAISETVRLKNITRDEFLGLS